MEILTETKDHTLLITLNRPEASNAYTSSMISDLVSALREAHLNDEIRSVLITGAGKNFCAGGDVKAMAQKTGMFSGESFELKSLYENGIQQIPLAMEELKKPVIALVQGAAVGAGCDLAFMCDLRIASERASFAETFTRVGLVPGDGGAFFLIRALGYARAMELFLLTETISAQEALKLGLVREVVLPEKLIDRGFEIAKIINSLPPIAVQLTKKSLKHAYESDLKTHLELVSTYQSVTQRTSDHFEAVGRLLGKEAAPYQNR